MEVSVSNQLYVFFVMILCGAVSGAVFDFFRALRKIFGAGMLTTSIGDILFWLAISIGIFLTIFTVNNGQIRWFEIIGICIGSVIYFLTLSHLVMCVFGGILRFLIKIFLTIFKFVLTPLVFLYKMIKGAVVKVCVPCKKIGYRAGRGAYALKRSVKKFKLVSKKS